MLKKVLRLVSIQLWAVLGEMLSIGNKNKKKPKTLYLGIGFFVILMSSISFFYSFMIGSGLKLFDSIEILPPMMMSVTCIILLMTTIFKIKGTIFGFRDYDMIMSMPISTGGIVASRLVILYCINMLFVVIFMLPMTLAYGILAQPSVIFYLFSVIAILFIPLIPIIIASVIGTVIAYVASKFRHNNLLNIIFTMGILAVFLSLSFSIDDDGAKLVDMSKSLTSQIYALYPLAKLYTRAVVDQDVLAFGLFIALSLLAFALYTFVVKAVFKKMNTAIMTGRTGTGFRLSNIKPATPWKALYTKELKRYFASTIYVTNTAFGIVMLTLAAVSLFFVDTKTLFGPEVPAQVLSGIGPTIISFCVMMCCTTMSSISIEGKNLWILKSLPVEPKTIYLAKIGVNLTILAPAVIDAIILGIALKAEPVIILLMVLITVACSVFISFYGLIINLLLPNFSWTNETIVVKQSAASMVTIFSSLGIVIIQFLLMLLIPNVVAAYLCYLVVMLVVDTGLYFLLLHYGKRRFTELI